MRNFLRFILIGSFFATVEEFLTVLVLRKDVGAYVFTLLILFPTFLSLVYFTSKALDQLSDHKPTRELIHFFLFGLIGLMLEWSLMGLAPWSNPDAHPVAMFIFQVGMFSFWATVAFAPRLFLNSDPQSQSTKKVILRFYIPYFVVVYVLGLSVPESKRFITIIPLILLGYLILSGIFARYFCQAFRRRQIA